MLTRFAVKNFKSIKHLDLAMRPFMVLVGPNGAGKTNVVQALELFGAVLERGTTDPVRELGWDEVIRREKKAARGGLGFYAELTMSSEGLRFREPSAIRSNGSVTVKARLELGGARGADDVHVTREELIVEGPGVGRFRAYVGAGEEPQLELDDGLLWHAVAGGVAGVLQRNDAERYFKARLANPPGGSEPHVLRLLSRLRNPSLILRSLDLSCAVRRFRLDASSLRSDAQNDKARTRDLLSPTGAGLAMAVDRLRRTPASFARVLSALQKVYPRVENVSAERIQPGQLALMVKERGISEPLGQMSISDGVLHALALLLMLEQPSSRPDPRALEGILAIEEPENAIHPWPLRALIGEAQERGPARVLITTHSPVVVDAVTDPGSLFVVENAGRVGTTVTAARDREAALDAILATSGEKLGQVWMAGGIGGVPRSSE